MRKNNNGARGRGSKYGRGSYNHKKLKQDAFPIIGLLSKKINSFPIETLRHLKKIFSHENKRKIRLQRLNGEKSNGRGFVIDSNYVVDGLTKRMANTRKLYNPSDIDITNIYSVSDRNFFGLTKHSKIYNLNSLIQHSITSRPEILGYSKNKKIAVMENTIKCPNYNKLGPMNHGSLVHQELYKAVSYIIKISGIVVKMNSLNNQDGDDDDDSSIKKARSSLNQDKRKLPKRFEVDSCTMMALKYFLIKGIIPISSEWPAFTRQPPGCATAIDIIAIDTKNDYKITMIEIKTGSIYWTVQKPRAGEDQWLGIFTSMWQLIVSSIMCRVCYGNLFDWSKLDFKLVHVRPWGCVPFNIPMVFLTPRFCQMLWNLTINPVKSMSMYLTDSAKLSGKYNTSSSSAFGNSKTQRSNGIKVDKDGTLRDSSLRSNISNKYNTQAHITTKGTPRKSKPRVYNTGF